MMAGPLRQYSKRLQPKVTQYHLIRLSLETSSEVAQTEKLARRYWPDSSPGEPPFVSERPAVTAGRSSRIVPPEKR